MKKGNSRTKYGHLLCRFSLAMASISRQEHQIVNNKAIAGKHKNFNLTDNNDTNDNSTTLKSEN